MSMSQRIIRPRVLEENRAWIHRDFLSDKLRARERYWRFLSSQEVLTSGPFLHQKIVDDDGGAQRLSQRIGHGAGADVAAAAGGEGHDHAYGFGRVILSVNNLGIRRDRGRKQYGDHKS